MIQPTHIILYIFTLFYLFTLGSGRSFHIEKFTVLSTWRENWHYTQSKMDETSARFYRNHQCRIVDASHLADNAFDVFSLSMTTFLTCHGLEERVITVAVCDPICRNRMTNCSIIKNVDNNPIFRMEKVKDRRGSLHKVQVPVACKCQIHNPVRKLKSCTYDSFGHCTS